MHVDEVFDQRTKAVSHLRQLEMQSREVMGDAMQAATQSLDQVNLQYQDTLKQFRETDEQVKLALNQFMQHSLALMQIIMNE